MTPLWPEDAETRSQLGLVVAVTVVVVVFIATALMWWLRFVDNLHGTLTR